jgi:hypothetical protein
VTTPRHLRFSTDRVEALAAIDSIREGRGWCNVTPLVEEDVPDMKVNYFGLGLNKGVTVASFVTAAPRHGVVQPSMLGLLHSRSRLGAERIASMLHGVAYTTKQDHNTRGLLLIVPNSAPSSEILEVMCSLTETLCDFDFTGSWDLAVFVSEAKVQRR